MKFLCICQSGLGSSFMVQMNIQNVLTAVGAAEDITVDHSDVGSTTADMADYFFVEETLGEAISSIPAEQVVLLDPFVNFMSAAGAFQAIASLLEPFAKQSGPVGFVAMS